MESFYGGRRGISFIIVRQFDGLDIPQVKGKEVYTGNYYAVESDGTFHLDPVLNEPVSRTEENKDLYTWRYHFHDGSKVREDKAVFFPKQLARGMKQHFEQGNVTINEVGYGEYVIIDTIQNCHDYNNSHNGKVYRRGMDYQGELGGAIYVGQIVGPQGDTPSVDIEGYTKVVNNLEAIDNHYNRGAYNTINGDLVPGKTNDEIKYAWYDIKDDIGNIEGVQIGFSFPYTEFDFTSESISAYVQPTITRIGDTSKPYYYEMHLGIPKGIRGTDATDIRIADASDGKGDAFWYTETDYTNEIPQVTDKEIGPYKVIDEVSLAEDGTLRVDYTYDSPLILEKIIKWIKKDNANGIELAADGTVTINYNTGEKDVYPQAITWITDASLADTGEFELKFNNNQTVQDINKILRWINRVEIDNDGTLTYYYNTGEVALKKNKYLKIIKDVQINTGAVEGDGTQKVVVEYNTGDKEEIGNPLNYIIETTMTDEAFVFEKGYDVEAYHFLVLYADPAKRGNVTYYSEVFGADRNDWVDLGYIRGDAGGIHIIGDFDSIASLQDANGQWLPPEQVEGWIPARAGWSYTINEKEIYSYDYMKKIWYPLGTFKTDPDEFVIVDTKVNGKPSSLDSILREKGLWFVAEPIKFAE